jgi:hypothetical protein
MGKRGILLAVAALVAVVSIYGLAKWRAQHFVWHAGFWFEEVTFDVPHLRAAGYGGGLTDEEKQTIERVAMAELRTAFAGLRIVFSDDRAAHYRVRVVQQYPEGRGTGVAGQSRAARPLGGNGSVNFLMLASQAVSHAPRGADRATIVNGIGTGIGRAAVHEFAHQLIARAPIHDSKDERSYEFAFSSRPGQYYGEMHWDLAWKPLVDKLGPVDPVRAAARTQEPE